MECDPDALLVTFHSPVEMLAGRYSSSAIMNDRFCLDGSVTRSQMAALLTRVGGPGARVGFPDVDYAGDSSYTRPSQKGSAEQRQLWLVSLVKAIG